MAWKLCNWASIFKWSRHFTLKVEPNSLWWWPIKKMNSLSKKRIFPFSKNIWKIRWVLCLRPFSPTLILVGASASPNAGKIGRRIFWIPNFMCNLNNINCYNFSNKVIYRKKLNNTLNVKYRVYGEKECFEDFWQIS